MADIKSQEESMIEITGLIKRNQMTPGGIAIGGVRITPGLSPSGSNSVPTPASNQVVIDVEGWRRVPVRVPRGNSPTTTLLAPPRSRPTLAASPSLLLLLGFFSWRPAVLGGRSTVGHRALDAVIGVRIPASQPILSFVPTHQQIDADIHPFPRLSLLRGLTASLDAWEWSLTCLPTALSVTARSPCMSTRANRTWL